MHPYQSRTRNRDRRLAQRPSAPTNPALWVIATGYSLILIIVVFAPFAEHLL